MTEPCSSHSPVLQTHSPQLAHRGQAWMISVHCHDRTRPNEKIPTLCWSICDHDRRPSCRSGKWVCWRQSPLRWGPRSQRPSAGPEQANKYDMILGANIQFRFLEHVYPGDSDDDGDAHRLWLVGYVDPRGEGGPRVGCIVQAGFAWRQIWAIKVNHGKSLADRSKHLQKMIMRGVACLGSVRVGRLRVDALVVLHVLEGKVHQTTSTSMVALAFWQLCSWSMAVLGCWHNTHQIQTNKRSPLCLAQSTRFCSLIHHHHHGRHHRQHHILHWYDLALHTPHTDGYLRDL